MIKQIKNLFLSFARMMGMVSALAVGSFTVYLFAAVSGAALLYSTAYAGSPSHGNQMGRLLGALGAIEPGAGESGIDNTPVGPKPDKEPKTEEARDSDYQVQAVLVAKRSAVISSTMDGRLVNFPYKNGDIFEKGSILAEYDCSVDYARLKEMKARERQTESQLNAFKQLRTMHSVSQIELVTATENNEQNIAQVEQVKNHLALCKIVAPFRGRVTNKMASQYEFVQTGRTLLDIASREQLQTEFLIPSRWLRWLNIGTPVTIFVEESNKYYAAKIIRIHGEVDPVSQSVQVAAEIENYHEELLPGMSGRAIFSKDAVNGKPDFGFLGLALDAGRSTKP